MKNKTDTVGVLNNIVDSYSYVEIKGVQYAWNYSNLSHINLLNNFNFKNLQEIEKSLKKGESMTILKMFYVGIVWGDGDVPFERFIHQFKPFDPALDKIAGFLNEYIPKYLDIKKKEGLEILIPVVSFKELMKAKS